MNENTISKSSSSASNFAEDDDFARLLLNSSGEGIYGIDMEGNCIFANPACARVLGFDSVDDLVGQHMHKLVHHTRANGDPYPPEECLIYQAFIRNEGTHIDDEVMFRADGKPFPAEYRSYPVNRDGKLAGCVVTFVDITERRRNEELIAEIAHLPEMNPGPVVRLDTDGIVHLANSAARSVFGDDIVGQSWCENLCEIDHTIWVEIVKVDEPYPLEKQIGDRHYVFNHCKDPKTDFIFVFGTDISAQKQAEESLNIYSRIVSASTDFLAFVDRDYCYQAVNDAYLKAFKKSIDEVAGHNVKEILGIDGFNTVKPLLEDALAGKNVDHYVWLDLPEAGRRYFHVKYNPFRDANNEVSGLVVNSRDVTEQKEAEQALREAHEQVRLLLDSSGEGIYGIDLKGNCTFANPACARVLGFDSVDDLLGQQMHKLVHHTRANGEPYPVDECRIYQAFRRNEGTHVDDEVMFRADGQPFPVEYWSHPIIRDDELVGCVVTLVDITERRRVENELRQTEKMAALGKLSAGLSHELNNPAAAATSAANQLDAGINDLISATINLAQTGLEADAWVLLKELRQRPTTTGSLSALEASDREEELMDWLDERDVADSWAIAPVFVTAGIEIKDLDAIVTRLPQTPLSLLALWLCHAITAVDLAGVVERSTRSISELVNVVKSYSHMDRGPSHYVDVHQGIEDTIKILGHKLKQGVEVVREFDRSLPQLKAQGGELNQVWTNLFDNAVSAMDGKGTLTIRTFLKDDQVMVEVADDGPGIPKEIQHRVFEPFFTTKDVGVGTGLGLDVVNRIITNRCGGRIDFETGTSGTTFRIYIPIEMTCPVEDEEALEAGE